MRTYPAAVAGESFANKDGSDRQAEIGRCHEGERVFLEREPDNPYDSNCVKVISIRGVQIGNIARAAAWIGERLDRDEHVEAKIARLASGPDGKRGVVLEVTVD